MKVVISKTAWAGGFGCHKYKWAAGFTPKERIIIKNGGLVAFDCGKLSGGNHGTTWRIATYKEGCYGNRYGRRVPTQEELEQIKEASNETNQV